MSESASDYCRVCGFDSSSCQCETVAAIDLTSAIDIVRAALPCDNNVAHDALDRVLVELEKKA